MIRPTFATNILRELRRSHLTVTVIFVCLIAQLLVCSAVSVEADSEVYFSSENVFEIPSKNSSISFGTNGTYEAATLEDGVWSFRNLYIADSRAKDKLNLTISATDCDLTFYSYVRAPYSYGVAVLEWVILRYFISGQGTQVINLGLDPDNGQLDVILDGNFAPRNQDWTKAEDGTLTITGSHSNVTLWYIRNPEPSESDSLLTEHNILLGSTGFFAFIVFLAVIIKKHKSEVRTSFNRINLTSNPEETFGGK